MSVLIGTIIRIQKKGFILDDCYILIDQLRFMMVESLNIWRDIELRLSIIYRHNFWEKFTISINNNK